MTSQSISQFAGDNAIQIGSVSSGGAFVLKLDNSHGGTVRVALPEKQQPPKLRPLPIKLAPRSFPLLLGRREEIQASVDALPYEQPVNCYGDAGIGKTVFLRYLSHHPLITAAFPAGIIYHRCNRYQGISDILQILFNAFYENSIPLKLTDREIRLHLQDRKMLLVLDDASLEREQIEALHHDLPSCTLLIASSKRQLWGEGQARLLGGLSLEDSLVLVERELGRSIESEERAAAESLWHAVEGNPLQMLQTVACVREENRSLATIAQPLARGESWVEQLRASLDRQQLSVIALLVSLGANVVLGAKHIANITEQSNARAILESLLRRNLVRAEGTQYGIASGSIEGLSEYSAQSQWINRSLSYFADWAELQDSPKPLLEELDALMSALDWAARSRQWEEVLRLGQAVEGALAFGGLWDTWAIVLQWMLEAAKQLGNLEMETYALHQLGTLALCLGQVEPARTYLQQALRIRQDILGDEAAAEVTSNNLKLLPEMEVRETPQPPREQPSATANTSAPKSRLPVLLAGGVLSLLSFIGLFTLLAQPNSELGISASPNLSEPEPASSFESEPEPEPEPNEETSSAPAHSSSSTFESEPTEESSSATTHSSSSAFDPDSATAHSRNRTYEDFSHQESTTEQQEHPDPTVLHNDEWTITIGNYSSWSGVNGTGNLTYRGCNVNQECLELTGGTVTCRNGVCKFAWQNGSYTYTLTTPITNNPADVNSTLTVSQNGATIRQIFGLR